MVVLIDFVLLMIVVMVVSVWELFFKFLCVFKFAFIAVVMRAYGLLTSILLRVMRLRFMDIDCDLNL